MMIPPPVLAFAALLLALHQTALFDITCPKDGDAVRVVREASGIILDVTSRSGIGGATVERRTVQWPVRLILRLHLGGLESLSISNGALTLRASIESAGGAARISYGLRNGEEGPAPEKGGPYWTEINVIGPGGGFELAVPPALLSGAARTLEIGWIDFYRR